MTRNALTGTQMAAMYLAKSRAPYRIIYGVIDKDTGEFEVYAGTSMRTPNKLTREGHKVFTLR